MANMRAETAASRPDLFVPHKSLHCTVRIIEQSRKAQPVATESWTIGSAVLLSLFLLLCWIIIEAQTP